MLQRDHYTSVMKGSFKPMETFHLNESLATRYLPHKASQDVEGKL